MKYEVSCAYIFDIWAGVDGDNVTVLDPQIVSDNSVQSGAAVIKIVVGENDQDCVLSLLASNQNCVATEELESLHGVV